MQLVYLCNKVVNNQTPKSRLGVSLLRENTYLQMFHIYVSYIFAYTKYTIP